MGILVSVVLVLCLLVQPASAGDLVKEDDVRALLASGRCKEARLLIQEAPNREVFLQSGVGKAYYAGSLCFSEPRDLTLTDLNNARSHAAAAMEDLRESQAWVVWLSTTDGQCRRLEQQVARGGRDHMGEYSGKIGGRCSPNASPALLSWRQGRQREAEEIFRSFEWAPLPPPPVPGGEGHLSQVLLPETLKARALDEHVGPEADFAACAPFVVLSEGAGAAAGICSAVMRFADHFSGMYEPSAPRAWIVVHHYTSPEAMGEHAKNFEGPACKKLFGYFDWRRQTIAYRAPKGYFGTLQHELTHALMYWDTPLGPRWFEEGVAALYENTDSFYRGLPNPWREDILDKISNPERRFFESVIPLSSLEFEASPEPATLARFAMRGLQQRGQLAPLYRELRAWAAMLRPEEFADAKPHEPPPEEWVDIWQERVAAHLPPGTP